MENNLSVIYCLNVGVDSDGMNIYHFLVVDNTYDEDSGTYKIDDIWMDGWEEIPACNLRNLKPDDSQYEYVKELKTDLILDLVQDNCCFSLSDCKDKCVALAYENINGYEDYPDPRIVIHYGDSLDEVEAMFAKRNLTMKFI